MKKKLGLLIVVSLACLILIVGGLIHAMTPQTTTSSHQPSQTSTTKTNQRSKPSTTAVSQPKKRATLTVNSQPTTPSVVKALSFYSPQLHRQWRYRVYLPTNYQRLKASGTHFASIYMLHGLYGDETNLTTQADSKAYLDRLIKQTGIPVVAIFPDGGNSFYLNNASSNMESAIVDDLIPKTTATYQLAGQSKRAIGGISMGGYGAARLIFRHPHLFSTGALISPAIWQQVPATVQTNTQIPAFKVNGAFSQRTFEQDQPSRNLPNYLKRVKTPAHFYIETTAKDTTVPVADVNRFVQQLRAQHIQPVYQVDHFGNHNWSYWQHALPLAYRDIFQQFKS
ncbi:alpha/beta hydrolase-fold protein [Secundilactobacillus similis DSM 23365 = JCM 2765]|uniref:Esterase n=1 Tax=Secundilactobacillus similis DSM 23365 = JCM 2765 TaxID=1423804 RepID=A0A0R2F7K1_9LACO|nr:alpha/beta hydrolase-fold protein [Secundilactobacillus similis]KRN22373.1 esterase [Secundilactobacillus similis DSM 23365 = JCM 2765]